jgi:DNA polymerase alpha subunit A
VSICALFALQEYNICFTTVKRPTDGSMPALPTAAASGPGSSSSLAPLPTVIQGLVRKRREVKTQMKSCRCVAVQATPAEAGRRQHALSLI